MSSRLFVTLALMTCLVGLGNCGSEVIDSTELARLKADELEVQKLRTENAQLTAELATAKSVGRYQIHQNGFRTWRLDATTGQDCILLTSEADWKKPETAVEGCASQ